MIIYWGPGLPQAPAKEISPAMTEPADTLAPLPPAQDAMQSVRVGPPSVEAAPPAPPVPEIGGRQGPDPTRFGDWEKGGHCIDF